MTQQEEDMWRHKYLLTFLCKLMCLAHRKDGAGMLDGCFHLHLSNYYHLKVISPWGTRAYRERTECTINWKIYCHLARHLHAPWYYRCRFYRTNTRDGFHPYSTHDYLWKKQNCPAYPFKALCPKYRSQSARRSRLPVNRWTSGLSDPGHGWAEAQNGVYCHNASSKATPNKGQWHDWHRGRCHHHLYPHLASIVAHWAYRIHCCWLWIDHTELFEQQDFDKKSWGTNSYHLTLHHCSTT